MQDQMERFFFILTLQVTPARRRERQPLQIVLFTSISLQKIELKFVFCICDILTVFERPFSIRQPEDYCTLRLPHYLIHFLWLVHYTPTNFFYK
jgi:hypothetical protein